MIAYVTWMACDIEHMPKYYLLTLVVGVSA